MDTFSKSFHLVCNAKEPTRCGNLESTPTNDATCIDKSKICDRCYDCHLGGDEANELCESKTI